MVLRNLVAVAWLSLSCSLLVAQPGSAYYDAGWKRVDSLINKKGLPQSALQEVELLYETAKKEKNEVQTLRALLFRIDLEGANQEDGQKTAITKLEKEIPATPQPARSILLSLLARSYLTYFNIHRWKLYNRTKTQNFIKEDIDSWGADDFQKKIGEVYLASLEERSLLQRTGLDSFEPLLVKGNMRKLRPTLFDLLAHEALNYFKNDDQDLNKPAYAFVINDPLVYAGAGEFVSHPFQTSDSLSLHFHALLLFQELIRLHLRDARPDALLDVDIERLQFARQYGTWENKEELYRKALTWLTEQFPDLPQAAQAWYLLAQQSADHAAEYKPLEDTAGRYGNVTARAICEKVVAEKENSEGQENCRILLDRILRKELQLQTEKINLPGRPFRGLVTWRNVGTAYFRLIRIDPSTKKDLGDNSWEDSYWKQLLRLPVSGTFSQTLPETGDHQTHRTEIRIDALAPGSYALIASAAADFSTDKNPLAVQYFYVSSIAYISYDRDFFVLNRESGQPLAGAAVQVWNQTYDYGNRKYTPSRAESYLTDAKGHFYMKDPVDGQKIMGQLLDITIPGDHLFMDDYSRNYFRAESTDGNADATDYERVNRRTFFFTDRSIYRPAQTLYFKAILTTKDFNFRHTKILSQCTTKLFLYNANNEKIDSVLLTSNDFGSVHGSFLLPEHQLNGVFRITEDSTNSQESFSVEEYKRPKFYVEFDPPQGIHRLGQSVTVKGKARAYAGNNIDGARIKFRVYREARFPNYWLFRGAGRSSAEQEIAHGEGRTEADGSFTVSFLALPDPTVSRNLDPIYHYQISTDVTDINGETRSGVTSVVVGYRVLSLAVELPHGDHLSADSLRVLTIRSTNLSGALQPAGVDLSIYKLKAPDRLIRRRDWAAPDQFVMTRSTYLDYFPHDEYSDETQKESWERAEEIFHAAGSPDSAKQVYSLREVKFTAGWYLIEASTKDAYGQEVSTRQYVQLYDPATGRPANPEYEWASDTPETVGPGQVATIVNGSSATDLFVIRVIGRLSQEKGKGRRQLDFYTLNNEKKRFSIPVTDDDRGGFEVADAFVKDNALFLSGHQVLVPWTDKELTIGYSSYRDKTLPGSKEIWQVSIRGYKGDKVAAEVLTGMYDASLDQFKPQRWFIPDLYPVYAARSSWNPMNNFYAPFSVEKVQNDRPSKPFIKDYDQLITAMNPYDLAPFRANNYQSLDERVVIGYGTPSGQALSKTMQIRGVGSAGKTTEDLLFVIDGIPGPSSSMGSLNPNDIQSIQVLKAGEATAIYGIQAAGGVVVVTTKTGALRNMQQEVQVRKNFAETAFFFPDLVTDSAGNVSFSFTMPEALTRWKWMILAHTREAAFGYSEKSVITQKQLMVQPNAPRFLRQGDRMELSAKVVNLDQSELKGLVSLQLIDPSTNQVVDGPFGNRAPIRPFDVKAGQSVSLTWSIGIPAGYDGPLTYKIIAAAPLPSPSGSGNASESRVNEVIGDGEEATLPVLSNRMLVTETLPLNLPGDGTRKFRFGKLLQSGVRSTLQQHALTVEFTSNPAWYAIQALPYLMEYPYECAEQLFDRFYANSLATHILGSSPRIRTVFERWKTADTAAFLSNLQKNQELKSVLLEETPWVLEGKTESQQKKNIALLFDMTRMSRELGSALTKLEDLQTPNGGFAWFKGGPDDRYITQIILTGIGHLQKMVALPDSTSERIKPMIDAALSYLDKQIIEDDERMKQAIAASHPKDPNLFIETLVPGPVQVQYLYMRSFFADRGIPGNVLPALTVFRKQAQRNWPKLSSYMEAMTALALHRTGDIQGAREIISSLRQKAIRDASDADKGMYWKGMEGGYYWYEAPVETESLMIEAFREIAPDAGIDRDLKTWLLRQKQTHSWPTTRATADACYALLMAGGSWLSGERKVELQLGGKTVSSACAEAGTGYFKKVFDGGAVDTSMGNITVTLSPPSVTADSPAKPGVKISPPAWGAVYWQYFEDLDKIVPPGGTAIALRLTKKLFVEKNTDRGPVLEPVNEKDTLKVGDKIRIRIELTADRDLEYVHMKDMRASCMEPVNVLSQYKWQGGLGYYETTKDAGTDFFFSWLPRGTYVFEYPVFVGQAGNFSNGITSIGCMYAPEFTFHSEGVRVQVKEK